MCLGKIRHELLEFLRRNLRSHVVLQVVGFQFQHLVKNHLRQLLVLYGLFKTFPVQINRRPLGVAHPAEHPPPPSSGIVVLLLLHDVEHHVHYRKIFRVCRVGIIKEQGGDIVWIQHRGHIPVHRRHAQEQTALQFPHRLVLQIPSHESLQHAQLYVERLGTLPITSLRPLREVLLVILHVFYAYPPFRQKHIFRLNLFAIALPVPHVSGEGNRRLRQGEPSEWIFPAFPQLVIGFQIPDKSLQSVLYLNEHVRIDIMAFKHIKGEFRGVHLDGLFLVVSYRQTDSRQSGLVHKHHGVTAHRFLSLRQHRPPLRIRHPQDILGEIFPQVVRILRIHGRLAHRIPQHLRRQQGEPLVQESVMLAETQRRVSIHRVVEILVVHVHIADILVHPALVRHPQGRHLVRPQRKLHHHGLLLPLKLHRPPVLGDFCHLQQRIQIKNKPVQHFPLSVLDRKQGLGAHASVPLRVGQLLSQQTPPLFLAVFPVSVDIHLAPGLYFLEMPHILIQESGSAQQHDTRGNPQPHVFPRMQGQALHHHNRENQQGDSQQQKRHALRQIRLQIRMAHHVRENVRQRHRKKVKSPVLHVPQIKKRHADKAQHDDKRHRLISCQTHNHEGKPQHKNQ